MKYEQSINKLHSIVQKIMQEHQYLVVGCIDPKLENALEDARIDAICAGVSDTTIQQIIRPHQYID